MKSKLRVLNRENQNWLNVVIQKDEKEKEYKALIENLEKNLDEKKFEYSDLLEKFNLRLDPVKRKQIFGEMGMKIIQNTFNYQKKKTLNNIENVNDVFIGDNKEHNNETANKNIQDNLISNGAIEDNLSQFRRSSNKVVRRTAKHVTISLKLDKKETIIQPQSDKGIKLKSSPSIVKLDEKAANGNDKNNIENTTTKTNVERSQNGTENTNLEIENTHKSNRRSSVLRRSRKEVQNLLDQQVSIDNMNSLNQDLTIKNLVKLRNNRNSLQNKTLKKKISTKALFDQRKFNIIDNTILNLDHQLKLYINKGIYNTNNLKDNFAQTDIQAAESESITPNNLVKDLESESNQIFNHLESLKKSHNMKTINTMDKAIDQDLYKLKENYNNLLINYNSLAENFDLSTRHNEYLLDELDKEKEKTEFVIETNREILTSLAKCLSEDSNEIFEFLEYKNEKDYSKEVKEILLKILARNEEIFKNEKFSSIYEFLSHFKIKSVANLKFYKNNENNSANSLENYSPVPTSKSNLTQYSSNKKIQISYKNVFKETYNEFKSRNTKIKVNLSQRKILKIINTVYFELLEKIYFKKEHNIELSRENDYVEFPEVLCFYFIQNYGLESLAKKKFLEFLQALENYEFLSKRVSLFKKMISVDDSILNKTYYDHFISRQILSLILKLKNHKCIIKSADEENLQLFLVTNKIIEIISSNVKSPQGILRIQQNLGNFIEANKKLFTKNMRNYTVIDFDDFLEKVIDVFSHLKSNFTKMIKSIFNSLDIEEKYYLTFSDFLIINQYLFSNKLSYKKCESLFSMRSSSKEFLTYDQFELLAIELELLDEKILQQFLKVSDEKTLEKIFVMLQEELHGSANTIFNEVEKRINVLPDNSTEYINLFNKSQTLKTKITQIDLDSKNSTSIDSNRLFSFWISLRILDETTYNIYNEFKLKKIYRNLENVSKILEESWGDKTQENLIIMYLKNNKSLN